MRMIRRIHQYRTVFGIQSFIYQIEDLIRLIFACKTTDHCPALRIKPHIGFRITAPSDHFSGLGIATDKTVFIPAIFLDQRPEFFLLFFQIRLINAVLFILRKFL